MVKNSALRFYYESAFRIRPNGSVQYYLGLGQVSWTGYFVFAFMDPYETSSSVLGVPISKEFIILNRTCPYGQIQTAE